MTYDTYLEAIRRESAALADAAAGADLALAVPGCPGWDLAELVTHISQVQRWVTRLVETRATVRPARKVIPEPPPREERVAWFREATADLLAALRSADPAEPMWTWTGAGGAAYWARRQAHEVAVHRWDAQQAVGLAPQALAGPFAADGVDELFELLRCVDPSRFVGRGETIHLHATDLPVGWLVRLGAEGLEFRGAHGAADATARGVASDLDLFLWGRVPVETLEHRGDAALLQRLQDLTAL